MVVVGAGYIAVEMAGIFNALGADTSICIRYDQVDKNGWYIFMPLDRIYLYMIS